MVWSGQAGRATERPLRPGGAAGAVGRLSSQVERRRDVAEGVCLRLLTKLSLLVTLFMNTCVYKLLAYVCLQISFL